MYNSQQRSPADLEKELHWLLSNLAIENSQKTCDRILKIIIENPALINSNNNPYLHTPLHAIFYAQNMVLGEAKSRLDSLGVDLLQYAKNNIDLLRMNKGGFGVLSFALRFGFYVQAFQMIEIAREKSVLSKIVTEKNILEILSKIYQNPKISEDIKNSLRTYIQKGLQGAVPAVQTNQFVPPVSTTTTPPVSDFSSSTVMYPPPKDINLSPTEFIQKKISERMQKLLDPSIEDSALVFFNHLLTEWNRFQANSKLCDYDRLNAAVANAFMQLLGSCDDITHLSILFNAVINLGGAKELLSNKKINCIVLEVECKNRFELQQKIAEYGEESTFESTQIKAKRDLLKIFNENLKVGKVAQTAFNEAMNTTFKKYQWTWSEFNKEVIEGHTEIVLKNFNIELSTKSTAGYRV